MPHHRTMIAKVASALAVLALVSVGQAGARGVTLIQQSDGTVRTYGDVAIRSSGQTLTLQSADKKGILTVTMGACSFTNKIERCLPYNVTLTQSGATRQIAIVYGTVFLNLTAQEQHMSRSSEELAPRTVLVLLKTKHGTYLTSKGRLDEVNP